MNDIISEDNNKNMENTNDVILEKSNECNDADCKVKISKYNKSGIEDQGTTLNKNDQKTKNKMLNDGEIVVVSILDCGEQENLQGVKINLYKINGLSPVLIKSKTTDEEGKVIFSEVEDGCYRIIEIIDKKHFEKPKYINWNEIIIDSDNKKAKSSNN